MAVRTWNQIRTAIASVFVDNTRGQIVPTKHRGFLTDLADTAEAAAKAASAAQTTANGKWSFVRYANKAALPSTVPANTVAWYPEA